LQEVMGLLDGMETEGKEEGAEVGMGLGGPPAPPMPSRRPPLNIRPPMKGDLP
jgi:hypothetical protein